MFCFTDTAPTALYPLSLHDALPISGRTAVLPPTRPSRTPARDDSRGRALRPSDAPRDPPPPDPRSRARERSEEHTSELQSLRHLVCRLLLEKKNMRSYVHPNSRIQN